MYSTLNIAQSAVFSMLHSTKIQHYITLHYIKLHYILQCTLSILLRHIEYVVWCGAVRKTNILDMPSISGKYGIYALYRHANQHPVCGLQFWGLQGSTINTHCRSQTYRTSPRQAIQARKNCTKTNLYLVGPEGILED